MSILSHVRCPHLNQIRPYLWARQPRQAVAQRRHVPVEKPLRIRLQRIRGSGCGLQSLISASNVSAPFGLSGALFSPAFALPGTNRYAFRNTASSASGFDMRNGRAWGMNSANTSRKSSMLIGLRRYVHPSLTRHCLGGHQNIGGQRQSVSDAQLACAGQNLSPISTHPSPAYGYRPTRGQSAGGARVSGGAAFLAISAAKPKRSRRR